MKIIVTGEQGTYGNNNKGRKGNRRRQERECSGSQSVRSVNVKSIKKPHVPGNFLPSGMASPCSPGLWCGPRPGLDRPGSSGDLYFVWVNPPQPPVDNPGRGSLKQTSASARRHCMLRWVLWFPYHSLSGLEHCSLRAGLAEFASRQIIRRAAFQIIC